MSLCIPSHQKDGCLIVCVIASMNVIASLLIPVFFFFSFSGLQECLGHLFLSLLNMP